VWNAFRIKKLLNANGALLFSTISRKFLGKARCVGPAPCCAARGVVMTL